MCSPADQSCSDRAMDLLSLYTNSAVIEIPHLRNREDIPEELVDQVILKSKKTAKEQLDTCPDERAELKAEYRYAYDVISEYAPKMMSDDEIRAFLAANFAEVLASKNKGQIMKAVMPALKGKADGKAINAVVAQML